MHSHLKLQHHRHTGKLLPHYHTSYRVLGLIMAIVAVCLFMINSAARAADDIVVTAKVSAQIPTSAVTIDNPPNNSFFSNPNITVSGTCPIYTPSVVVIIYSGSSFLGSTNCSSTGTYSIPVTLFPGLNPLVARVSNVTGDYGPDSQVVNVTYAVPANSSPGGNSTTGQPLASGLGMRSRSAFIVFGPQKDAVWVGSFFGGRPPYYTAVDWGDGNVNNYVVRDETEQEFRHTYRVMQPYFITINVKDKVGNMLERTFAAVTPYANSSRVSDTPVPNFIGLLDTTLWRTIIIYAWLVLALLFLWYDARYLHLGRPIGVHYHPPARKNKRFRRR